MRVSGLSILKQACRFDYPFLESIRSALPRSFVAPYGGSHPAVMADRIAAFSESLSLEDPRWRLHPGWRERQRLLETWFYRRFGIPGLRSTRCRLLGGYLPKSRD